MVKRSLVVLIVINALLLGGLASVSFAPSAEAQIGRRGHRYLMISGQVTARNDQAIFYVLNLDTAQVVSGVFNSSNNELDWIARRNITRDLQRGLQRR